ncbi:hypothetical protein HDU98_009158, partial [Podochytrium sp. JEL0797]
MPQPIEIAAPNPLKIYHHSCRQEESCEGDSWNNTSARNHKNVKLSDAPYSETHPHAAADFRAIFKNEIRLKEDAVDLIRNEHKKTPSALPSNFSISASILRIWIDDLKPDNPLVHYMHELSTAKMDPSMPSFTTLHSMFWAILVSWAGVIKSALKDTRQELAGQIPSNPKEVLSHPKEVDFHDDNSPVLVASKTPRTNFTWRTHSFSRHEVAVSGAGPAFVKSLTNGPIKPTEIENQLSALDQDLLDSKTCMMQLMTRLAHLGITTTIAVFVDSFFDGLLALFATFPFSLHRAEFDSFIDSDSFYCGAASSNVDDIFVALSASTDKVSQSVEILESLRDADRLKTNARSKHVPSSAKPLPTPTSGCPNPSKSLLQTPSKSTTTAVDKKRAVKENVKLSDAPYSETHPHAAADFRAIFKNEIRLKEDAVDLIRNEHKKTPSALPSNFSISAYILRIWIDDLKPDNPLVHYMHELSTAKMDLSKPSFTMLHSMFWAILVPCAGVIKSALKDTRQELAGQIPSNPKEVLSHPKEVDFHDDNSLVPVTSKTPRTNFTWWTHLFSRHEVAVSGAGPAFVKPLMNGPIKPTKIENQLSALDQDLLNSK